MEMVHVVPDRRLTQRPPHATLIQAARKNPVPPEVSVTPVQPIDILAAVVINEENILVRLWRIAALHNVGRLTRNDDSGHARHAHNLPLTGRKVNK